MYGFQDGYQDMPIADFLKRWWYIPGIVGALGLPHSYWTLIMKIELGRNLPNVRR